MLDALLRLQERLNLPSSLVKEMRRKLAKVVDRSVGRSPNPQQYRTLKRAQYLGETIAESDIWEKAKPEEVRSLVTWLVSGAFRLLSCSFVGSIY